jgi:LmbE family N-acetylglucosaminyl deacetylase
MRSPTRRTFLTTASAASASALALPLVSTAQDRQPARRKIVVVGGHPDDPESGCGGTMARFADLGHEVVALYLTRGEEGIEGKSHEEAAAIRTAEAQNACRILGAQAVFAGQVDGETEVNSRLYDEFEAVLMAQKPEVVFTQWPVDTHRDHRAASLLTYEVWLQTSRGPTGFALYYYEVMTGSQTQVFRPTHYVDITATQQRKRDAIYAHASQKPADWFGVHDEMNRFRGREHGCGFAEAFVHHDHSRAVPLP